MSYSEWLTEVNRKFAEILRHEVAPGTPTGWNYYDAEARRYYDDKWTPASAARDATKNLR